MPYNPPARVSGRYGAPMGRPSRPAAHADGARFYLRRVRLNAGGYDDGGAYWGHGLPLYHYHGADDENSDVAGYLRAWDRADAKAQIREDAPDARFFQ